MHTLNIVYGNVYAAIKGCWFNRRTFHVPNLIQMKPNKKSFSLTLGPTHERFDVSTKPKKRKNRKFNSGVNRWAITLRIIV